MARFPQWLLLDGPFRQADRPLRMGCGQRRGGGALQRIEVGTMKLPPRALGPLCVRVLGQGFASPRVEGGLELSQRRLRSLLAECRAPCLDVGEKRFGVHEAPVVTGEGVATRASEDEGRISQGSTCPADEHVQVGGGVGRGAFGPQRFGQGVLRDVVAPPKKKQTEQLPGQAAPKGGNRQFLAIETDREASEQTDLDPPRAHVPISLSAHGDGKSPWTSPKDASPPCSGPLGIRKDPLLVSDPTG